MSQNIYNIIQGIVVAVLLTICLRQKWQFIGIEQESFHKEIELKKIMANTHSDSIHAISCLEAFAFILYNISVASACSDKYLKRRKARCQAKLGRCSRSKLTTYCADCYNRDLCSGNYTNRGLMIHEHARLISFQSCPDYLLVGFSALTFSKLGFYYAGKGTIKCFCCDISFTSMPSIKPISEIHKLRSPYCKFARGEDLSNIPIQHDDLKDGLPLHLLTGQPRENSNTSPRYNDYASLSMRLQSFENWRLLSPHPSELSAAGFFFTNNADLVRCFQCGIGFRDWSISDDPWIEHARHSPNCQHVSRVRGDRLVRLVKQADIDAVQHEQTCVAGMSAAAFACVDAGYRKEQVEKAIIALRMAHGVEPTVDVLVECLRTNNDRTDDNDAQNDNRSSATAVIQALVEEVKNITQERSALLEENQKLREEKLCKICFLQDLDTVFIPCGHMVACGRCAHQLNNCAICRTPIQNRIRAYLS